MKTPRYFLIYTWLTVVAWVGVIWLISSLENIDFTGGSFAWIVNGIGYELMYLILYILIFRALLISIKLKVERLMYWKSKREKIEDTEFAYLIEGLLVIITFLATTLLAIVDEYHQSFVRGRIASVEDVLINITGMVIAATIIFYAPIVTEIEAIFAGVNQKKKETIANKQ